MAFKKRKSVKKMGKKWLGLASFFLSVDGVVVDPRLCLLESLIIPGFFWEWWWNWRDHWRRHSPASQRPPVDGGHERKGKFCHLSWQEIGCFLISVLGSRGARLQQEGGSGPALNVHLRPRKAWPPICCSPCDSCILVLQCFCMCVCVTSPGHPCWLLFDWESCLSENFQVTFRSNGCWKDKWKKSSANKDAFLTWLRVLFSFLPAEPWVTAAVLLLWESSECNSCFFS